MPGVSPQVSKENIGGISSVAYVCPKGFNGTYNVLVRRVWGNVTANKVKVEIFTHFLTEKQKCVSKWLPLEGDTVGVKFQLAGGRRTESLQEQQVASAAAAHLALQQAVQPQAPQQLASQVDPNAMATAYASRGYQGGGPNAEANAFTPSGAWGRRRLSTGDRHPARKAT